MLRILGFIFLLFSLTVAGAQDSSTLQTVKARGELLCGVSDLSPSTLLKTEDGGLAGFYTGFCRALAVAVLGDDEAVLYIPLSTAERFGALRRGEVDIVVGSLTVTSGREAEVDFGPVVFHEGAQHYAPALREGDDAWRNVVSWVIYALMQAEEWGVTSQNVAEVGGATGNVPTLQRFLGFEAALVQNLGLEPTALRRTLEEVGNYGELYERHLGAASSLTLPRGPNRPWTEGGLLYAPPFSLR